ncbi:hypothetical protein OROGR_006445 [Orobanche gracilis]
MGSLYSEDFAEEQYGSLAKRSRLTTNPLINQQFSSGNHVLSVPPTQYNPLDEPSPLGLRLRKSLSLLELIQVRLSEGSSADISVNPSETTYSGSKTDAKRFPASSAIDKLKATNFPALLLRIGSWEYVSQYEGDLVAKCYFAKHKLVWEVLEGGLKSKIEVQWSDIMALKAECPENSPGTLIVMLARPPAFFRETNPQPRKHTLWQATTDFTDGQATINKQHYIQCPPGVLNKHYEKLIQCDARLGSLSQQPEIHVDSPFFDSEDSVQENSEESIGAGYNQLPSPILVFEDAASAETGVQLSAFKFEHIKELQVKHVSKEAPSPKSVMDAQAIEGNGTNAEHDYGGRKNLESLEVPGVRPSMSMSDLVNHIENHISEQMASGSFPSAKASECQDMLENISQVLLNDTQCSTGLDETSLMKKVNSLCCLLQDPVVASSAQDDGESHWESAGLVSDSCTNIMGTAIPRRDSLGDLLLHLPRIASLPKFSKFLFGIVEDDEFY